MANLQLIRYHAAIGGTLGQLYLDGRAYCYTLEPPLLAVKKSDHPAIDCGNYLIGLHNSPSHGRIMPMLLGVPGRQYILIHPGNTARDTAGCILLGMSASRYPVPTLHNSRAAFAVFDKFWQSCLDKSEILSIGIIEQL